MTDSKENYVNWIVSINFFPKMTWQEWKTYFSYAFFLVADCCILKTRWLCSVCFTLFSVLHLTIKRNNKYAILTVFFHSFFFLFLNKLPECLVYSTCSMISQEKPHFLMVFQANFHGRGDGVVLTCNKTSRDMPLSEVTFLCGLTIMGLFLQ